jgi:hypothetical protein
MSFEQHLSTVTLRQSGKPMDITNGHSNRKDSTNPIQSEDFEIGVKVTIPLLVKVVVRRAAHIHVSIDMCTDISLMRQIIVDIVDEQRHSAWL